MERAMQAVRKAGKAHICLPLGHAMYPRTLAECKELGVTLLLCGAAPQVRLLRSYSQEIAELRRLTGSNP
jgi:predicted peroxiredoxin